MSLSNVRGYFRTHFENNGYKEWTDGFNRDDIPETIIDKQFHILTPNLTSSGHNMLDLQLTETVETQFYLKGYANPASAIDDAHTEIQTLLSAILGHENRTKSTSGIKNVVLDNIDIEPLFDDNDNVVRVTMRFGVLVIIRVTDT